jgi:cytochrome b561
MAPVSSGYSRIQIILHWAIAILVLLQYVGGDFMTEFYVRNGAAASSSAEIPLLTRAHVLLGILTLALVSLRLVVRLVQGAPALPEEEDPRLKLAAHATHIILYAVLFLAPISGLVGWFGQLELAVLAHDAMTTLLAVFAYLHIAAALYHQFILKNNLIKRMMKAV